MYIATKTLAVRKSVCCLAALMLFTGVGLGGRAAAAPSDDLVLVHSERSEFKIVLQPNASASEKHAAELLQRYIKLSTNVELPVLAASSLDSTSAIVLGFGPIAESLGVTRSLEKQVGDQGCLLRTVGPHLVVSGTASGGTLFGVRHFLKTQVGIDWITPDVQKIPSHDRLVFEPLDMIVRPAFAWRHISYTWPNRDSEFLAWRGLNDGMATATDPLGEQLSFDGRCHSYFRFISPTEFFESHPEYFSEINGRRIRDETQLCLTNPDVLDIVTVRMLERMRARPHDRQHNFSQMDWYNCCDCEKCRSVNEQYQSAGGTQFWFVNQLAERTSKVFPNKQIGTLAYMYTNEPPHNLKMHPNVAVWLCHMFPCCDSHSIESCSRNQDYRRRAEAWSRTCSHLYIWHYIVDFAHYYNPFPNFEALAADMRFYQRIGAEGIYAQGMGHGGGGGEFSLLRGYYVSELIRNPRRDAAAIIGDFLNQYYGPASPFIERYIGLLQDKVRDENIHMHLYTNPAQGYLSDDVLQRANQLFDQAEAAVRNEANLLERVRVARMPLEYAEIFPRNGYRVEAEQLLFNPPLGQPSDAQAFVARMGQHGFSTIRERVGDPRQLIAMSHMMNHPLPLVTLENQFVRVEIAPLLGGRVLRIIDRKTGRCATAYNTTRNLLFPFCGGESTRVGGLFTIGTGGEMDPAEVVRATASTVTLSAEVKLGYRIERTITLLADAPGLSIDVGVTNLGSVPRVTQVRSHLSLDLGPVRETSIRFTNRAGENVATDTTEAISRMREGQRFYRQECPDGKWTFTGDDSFSVTQQFDPTAVDFTWVYSYPADANELEIELWGKKVVARPNESIRLRQELTLGQ